MRRSISFGILVAALILGGLATPAAQSNAQIQQALQIFLQQAHTWTQTQTFNSIVVTGSCTGCGGGGGGIGGTIADTQIAFGTGADTIGGSANLTWDGATFRATGNVHSFMDGITGTAVFFDAYGVPPLWAMQYDSNTYYAGIAQMGAGANIYGGYSDFLKSRTTNGVTFAAALAGDNMMSLNSLVDNGAAMVYNGQIETYLVENASGKAAPSTGFRIKLSDGTTPLVELIDVKATLTTITPPIKVANYTTNGFLTTTGGTGVVAVNPLGTNVSSWLTAGVINATGTVPGLLRNIVSFDTTPVPSTPIGQASNQGGFQIQQCTWSAGTATCTLRTAQTNTYVAGTYVSISGMAAAYNGTWKTTATSSTTVSYALAADPGTSTVSYGLVYPEPEVAVTATSPTGWAIAAKAHASCTSSGHDVDVPTLASVGGDGNLHNYGWMVGCDGHSQTTYVANVLKYFENGVVTTGTSDWLIGWTSTTSSNPQTAANKDTGIGRNAAGVVEVNNGAAGTLRDITVRQYLINGKLTFSQTAPTISSGFGTSPSIAANNGTAAFTVSVGTGGTASSGAIGMPAATTGWVCTVTNVTGVAANRADQRTVQTASSTTSVTVQNQTISTGAALAWTASDVVSLACTAY